MGLKAIIAGASASLSNPVTIAQGGTGETSARAAAAALGTGYILAQSAVPVSVTGTLVETTLATITVPAGAMGPNGRIVVTVLFSSTASSNTKVYRVRFGGAAGQSYLALNQSTNSQNRVQCEIANRNSASSQVGAPATSTYTAFGASAGTLVTSTVDTTASTTIVVTGTLADTGETITLQSYSAVVFYGA